MQKRKKEFIGLLLEMTSVVFYIALIFAVTLLLAR